ncbi:hypothetical protein BKA65DRAFT_577883 [Rhexocercosporidium sp. MPI-PUGE-AT-0058]|nr:hypothetical protein BKA65DRAFT_577883 [Rhexocercosporidium sp. MPI-PUGE-AT-0058]
MPPKGTNHKRKTWNRNKGSRITSQIRESEGTDDHQGRNVGGDALDTKGAENVAAGGHMIDPDPLPLRYATAICSLGSGTSNAHTILRPAPFFELPPRTMVKVMAAGSRIPDSIKDDDAATLPSLAFTAYFYLFHPSALDFEPPSASAPHQIFQKQKSIVIIGADNILGRLAVQFASMANIPAIITIGRTQSLEQLKAFGATHLLEVESLKTSSDIQKARASIDAVTQGSPLCRVVDTTNSDVTLAASLLDTHTEGKIIGPLARYINYKEVNRPNNSKECAIIRGLYMDSHQFGSFGYKFWENIPGWLESKKLTPTQGYEVLPGGLDANIVNQKLDEMRNDSDGVHWSEQFVVRPWDEKPAVEIPLMRDYHDSGEM